MNSLYEYFIELEDFRDERGKKHKLVDVIVMTVYGIICGYTDFYNIADFLDIKKDYFTNLLKLENGTPSHDTLSRVFSLIDPDKFMEIFIKWIKDSVEEKFGRIINIDGKAIKSATTIIPGQKRNPPYIVSAFLAEVGISIGQVKVSDKSNEITAIPELLDLINIKDAIITIDSIGTQEKIINKIVSKEGHYCFNVKDNQRFLFDDIKTYFDYELNDKSSNDLIYSYTLDKDHGRIERREYFLSYEVNCIHNLKDKWQSVKTIGMVRNYREVKDEVTIDDKFYIMDTTMSMSLFKQSTRGHWAIENNLHWKLDVIFDEDHSRSRVKDSIINLATVRKFVFNTIKTDETWGKVPFQRKITRYNHDFNNIENLIFQVIPSNFNLT